MPDAPRLTVALPTYNGIRHLAEALRGILAQEVAAFDVLVCDDRSDDGTPDLVRAVAGDRARVELNSERLGLAGNWDRCVALSRTPLVAVFHQDDLMRPGHLAAHLAAFAADPTGTLGLVCNAADVVDAEGCDVPASVVERGGLGPVDRVFGPGEALAGMAVANPVRCSTVTLRAEAHAEAGGFDPSYRYVVDWACWLEVARRRPIAWLAAPTVAIRWHPASETHRFKAGTADLDESARLLDDLHARDGARLPDARGLRRAADRRLSRAFLNRAFDAAKAGRKSLARRCLRRAVVLWPGIAGSIALDPKLAVRLAGLALPGDQAKTSAT